jgi:stringent starvation protein B
MTTPDTRDETANIEKQALINNLMRTGCMVTIAINPRYVGEGSGVTGLPPRFAQQDHTILTLGYNLPRPTDDLVIAGGTLFVTLSFGGVPSQLAVPLEAIFVVVCEAQEVAAHWPHSTPPGVRVVHYDPTEPAPAPVPTRSKVVALDARRRPADLTACLARRAGGSAGGGSAA